MYFGRMLLITGIFTAVTYFTSGYRMYDTETATLDAVESFKASISERCELNATDVHLEVLKVE